MSSSSDSTSRRPTDELAMMISGISSSNSNTNSSVLWLDGPTAHLYRKPSSYLAPAAGKNGNSNVPHFFICAGSFAPCQVTSTTTMVVGCPTCCEVWYVDARSKKKHWRWHKQTCCSLPNDHVVQDLERVGGCASVDDCATVLADVLQTLKRHGTLPKGRILLYGLQQLQVLLDQNSTSTTASILSRSSPAVQRFQTQWVQCLRQRDCLLEIWASPGFGAYFLTRLYTSRSEDLWSNDLFFPLVGQHLYANSILVVRPYESVQASIYMKHRVPRKLPLSTALVQAWSTYLITSCTTTNSNKYLNFYLSTMLVPCYHHGDKLKKNFCKNHPEELVPGMTPKHLLQLLLNHHHHHHATSTLDHSNQMFLQHLLMEDSSILDDCEHNPWSKLSVPDRLELLEQLLELQEKDDWLVPAMMHAVALASSRILLALSSTAAGSSSQAFQFLQPHVTACIQATLPLVEAYQEAIRGLLVAAKKKHDDNVDLDDSIVQHIAGFAAPNVVPSLHHSSHDSDSDDDDSSFVMSSSSDDEEDASEYHDVDDTSIQEENQQKVVDVHLVVEEPTEVTVSETTFGGDLDY